MSPRARTQLRRLVAVACLAALIPLGDATASAAIDRSRTADRSVAVQREVDSARAAYEAARERVAGLSTQSSRLTAAAETSGAEATRLHDKLSDNNGSFFSAVGNYFGSGDSDLDRAAEAADSAELARDLATMAQGALTEEIAASEHARLVWERAERRQAKVAAGWTASEAADAAIRRSQFRVAYAESDPAQDRRNQRALRVWHQHLKEIARNAVVPPGLSELSDLRRLAAPLEPLRDVHNDLTPGVAVVDRPGRPAVTVPSAEAVNAVSEALRRVGLPEVPGAIDPMMYACGGLVANAWGGSTTTAALPADAAGQWESLRSVPTGSVQAGDVVLLGSKADGLAETGVYVGRDQVVLADPVTGVAAVRPLPRNILGVRRVGADARTGRHRAVPVGGVCTPPVETEVVTESDPGADPGSDTGAATTGGPFVLPLAPGSYQLTAGFGDAGSRWAAGEHTGLDFAAPVGTPVVAVASGTVTVEQPDWAGNLVRIDHGGGVETWYAHLSRVDVTTGQEIGQGDQLGLVGALGNTSGPHLHAEVRLDGAPYNPAQVFAIPELPHATYPNGEMPTDALCPATSDGLQLLGCDAAVAYRLLAAAYAATFGTEPCITDSYRSRTGQDQVFQEKPGLAALPGTSVHRLGRAVDLCGGIERFDSAENNWLREHGPDYGWLHPDWAAVGGSRPEPWHFEYPGGAG